MLRNPAILEPLAAGARSHNLGVELLPKHVYKVIFGTMLVRRGAHEPARR